MKKVFLTFLMSLLFIACSQQNTQVEQSLQKTLDSFREQYHIPGAVLLVKTPDFEKVFTTGMTAFQDGKPITQDTLFGVGSVTKTFISAMILKLEAEGKLSIHDPIGPYFPQYVRWKNITIEQLLNMTSGIANYTNDDEFKKDLNENFKKSWTADQLIDIGYHRPDDFKAGTDWSYTNTGYLLLGKIIEQVTHESVSEALNAQFFNPLKMHHTFYKENEYSPEVFNKMARGYYNGVIVKSTDLSNIGPAAGGMVMDAGDLSNFIDHLFIKKDILPQKQLDEMLTGSMLSSEKSGIPNTLFASGLGVVEDDKWGKMLTFTGTLPTHTATYLWIPEKQILIIAMAGLDRHGDKDSDVLFLGRPFMQNVMADIMGVETSNFSGNSVASSLKTSSKPQVTILTTGGTIASLDGAPMQDGDTLIGAVPQLLDHAAINVEEVARVGSAQITPSHWLLLATRINTLFREDPTLSGIVVTHGTDTLEDTAFFLNLTVKDPRPVVMTGSMRSANEISADGPANLLNAMRVAVNTDSVNKGVLVVLNERIASARDVWKTDNRNVATFRSPELGFLGLVDPEGVVFYRQSLRPHTVQSDFDVSNLKVLPKVAMLTDYPGFDVALMDGVIASKPAGVVMAGFAGGRLSDGARAAVTRAIAAGIPVVIASHVPGGRIVGDPLENLQAVLARNFSPNKARVLLMLALTRTNDLAELQRLFDKY